MGLVWRDLAWSVSRAPTTFTSASKIRMDGQIPNFPKRKYLRPLGADPSITYADQRMLALASGTTIAISKFGERKVCRPRG